MPRPLALRLSAGAVALAGTVALTLAPGAHALPAPAPGATQAAASSTVPAGWDVSRTSRGYVITRLPVERMPITDARPHVVTAGTDLGPATTRGDGSLVVVTRALPADLSTLAVRYGARLEADVVDSMPVVRRGAAAQRSTAARPAAAGTVTTTYTEKRIAVPGMPVPLDVTGRVVAPTTGTNLPVVLFLHGRHQWCDGETWAWPCQAPSKPVDNMEGYRYLQETLARRGYFTVSIDANAVNAQDGALPDAGMTARSALVRTHLAHLARWQGGASAPFAKTVAARYDATRTLVVGHSRGGEGASYAAIEQEAAKGYRIAGLALLGPTNFTFSSASTTPTVTVIPGCDGDVFDLEGARYADAATWYGPRHALSSLVYLPGANHNYFNTSWTPGAVTGMDDGEGTSCAAKSRLTPARQRDAGTAVVLAAADRFLQGKGDPAVLDGTGLLPKDQQWMTPVTSATGGARVRLADPATPGVTVTGASVCTGETCAPTGDYGVSTGVHWNGPAKENPAGWRWNLRRTAAVTITPRMPVSVAGAAALDARVVLSPNARYTPALRLTDAGGSSVVIRPLGSPTRTGVTGPADGMNGRWVAQNLRFPLPANGIDLTRIASASLEHVGAGRGMGILLDLSAASAGTTPTTLPDPVLLRMPTSETVKERNAPWTHTTRATLSAPAPEGMPALAMTYGSDIALTDLAVAKGAREIALPMPIAGNATWNPTAYYGTVMRVRGPVLTATPMSLLQVDDDDPMPVTTVTPTATAKPGGTLSWTMTLDRASGGYAAATLTAAAAKPALTTHEVAPAARLEWNIVDDENVPLEQAGARAYVSFDIGAKKATVTLPLAKTAKVGHQVVLDLEMEGATQPRTTRLVGTVVK